MTEHAELLAEMPAVGRMTTAERLKHAHKRRAQQLKTWAQMEKEAPHRSRGGQGSKEGRRITFPNNVTLLEAAARNDLEEVTRTRGHSLRTEGRRHFFTQTVLHIAAANGYQSTAELLLEHKARVEVRDSDGWSPLHAASCWGQIQIVELLVANGANLNAKSVLEETPLGLRWILNPASGANMLAVNADGNMPYDLCEDEVTLDYIETAMANQGITQERIDECRSSKERQMVADIRALIQTGCDLNAQDENGTSLLHIAAANGYQSTAELLLEHKARVEVRDSDGWSPLHAASCWGQIQIVELLVANGANLNAKSVLEETPLDVCSDEEVRARLLDLKHKHDAIMKSQDRHKSALQRRASSTGSRGKVVRRVSVNERSNLYRREHEKEAIVWQERGRQPEPQDDDEDRQTDAELQQHSSVRLIVNHAGRQGGKHAGK
ncbi:UNVERIFIED_CONTAM: hypothetical protein FKN15_069786 [Acipenser sinensis]